MSKPKNAFQIYLEYIPFIAVYRFVRLLPLHAAYRLSGFFFRIFFTLDARHRNRTLQHIAYSGIETDPAKIKKLALEVYFSFSRLLVEIAKMDQSYKVENMHPAGDPEGVEMMSGDHKEQFIIVTGHYGNWEMAGNAISAISGRNIYSVFRPFDNPKIGELILKSRASETHLMIDKKGGMRGCLKALKEGHHIALLVDQHAGAEGIDVNFFGKEASTHAAPALLHLKTGVPIVPLAVRRRNDNFEFDIVMDKPIRYTPTSDHEADIRNVTIMYTDALERLIRQEPGQWLWTHRRWNHINR